MPYGGERALNDAIAHLADVRGCCVFESLLRDVSGGIIYLIPLSLSAFEYLAALSRCSE